MRFAPSVQFCPRRIASSGSDVGYLPLHTCTAVQRQPQPLGGRNARIARYKKLFHSDNHILWEPFRIYVARGSLRSTTVTYHTLTGNHRQLNLFVSGICAVFSIGWKFICVNQLKTRYLNYDRAYHLQVSHCFAGKIGGRERACEFGGG